MPQDQTCAQDGCGAQAAGSWLLSGPGATYEVALCDDHTAPLWQFAALGRRVDVTGESESTVMDRLWRDR